MVNTDVLNYLLIYVFIHVKNEIIQGMNSTV